IHVTGEPRVRLDQGGGDPTINFALRRNLLPALVDIRNLSSSNIILTDGKWIDNPIGETRILNTGGNIVTGPNGTYFIRTNRLGDPAQATVNADFEDQPSGQFKGSVSFADNGANPDTITRTDNASWITNGFKVGDLIQIEGPNNPGVYEIA